MNQEQYYNNLQTNNLKTIFNEYISDCQYIRRLSEITIQGYKDVFQTFQKLMPEIKTLSDLTPVSVRLFFHRSGTRRRYQGNKLQIGVKPSTTSTYYNKLMAFFNWLETNKYLAQGFLTKRIKRPPTPIYEDEKALNDTEISKIIASITINNIQNSYQKSRDMTIITALLYLGIRRGELLGLRITDIDFNNETVFINKLTSKSKYDRYLPLHPVFANQIKNFLKLRKEESSTCNYLITSIRKDTPLTRHGLKHWVERYRRLSGVRFHLHQFRHTFTCKLAKTGADLTTIMKLLGHTSSRMTERYLRSINTKDAHNYINKLEF